MSIATAELCDADASGAEAATFEIITPRGGRLMLCGHHARSLWPVMEAQSAGFKWRDLMPSDLEPLVTHG